MLYSDIKNFRFERRALKDGEIFSSLFLFRIVILFHLENWTIAVDYKVNNLTTEQLANN